MSAPLRLGFSIRTFHPASGGLQSNCDQLARRLVARGHDVRVVTRSLSRAPSYADLFFYRDPVSSAEVEGVRARVARRPACWRPWMWMSFKCAWRARSRRLGAWMYRAAFEPETRKFLAGAQLVQHVGHGSDMIGLAAAGAARRLGVPFLAQPTVHPGQCGDSELDFLVYRQAVALITHTEFEARFFRERGFAVPIHVIGCALEERVDGDGARFREQHGLGHGPLVLYLGRKHADKGYPLVRESFERVRSRRPEAMLVCAGPYDLPPGMTPGQREKGVLELGFLTEDEKHDALAACSFLCVPSEGESFGLVYMEAAAYGKASIARRLPVLEELLGRADAALLLGDPKGRASGIPVTSEDLAAAMLQLLDSPDLAVEIGARARQAATEFAWPKVVGRYETAYRETLAAMPVATARG